MGGVSEKVVTLAHTSTALAALGDSSVFLSDPLQVGTPTLHAPIDGFTILKGYVNGDQNVTLDVYQSFSAADLATITKTAPAAGANDGLQFLTSIAFAGAANGPGAPITIAVVAPFVIVRATNTSGVLMTKFRLHLETAG